LIVCICNRVCERRLQALAEAGASTLEEVERLCGAGGDCGSCRPEVERILEDVAESRAVSATPQLSLPMVRDEQRPRADDAAA
jgi:bacterioferritin-associated ferredoxin